VRGEEKERNQQKEVRCGEVQLTWRREREGVGRGTSFVAEE
jgi:hypothetical protein